MSLNHGAYVDTPRSGHSMTGLSAGQVISVSRDCMVGVAAGHA